MRRVTTWQLVIRLLPRSTHLPRMLPCCNACCHASQPLACRRRQAGARSGAPAPTSVCASHAAIAWQSLDRSFWCMLLCHKRLSMCAGPCRSRNSGAHPQVLPGAEGRRALHHHGHWQAAVRAPRPLSCHADTASCEPARYRAWNVPSASQHSVAAGWSTLGQGNRPLVGRGVATSISMHRLQPGGPSKPCSNCTWHH